MRGKRSYYFLAFAFAPLLFILQTPERAEFLHQISLTFLRPFLLAPHAVSRTLHETSDGLRQFFRLYQSHFQLEKRVAELEQQQVEMEELEQENRRLRELLEFKKGIPGKTIAARVLGQDLALWRKTVLIDKGSHHGIKKRMAVVNAQGLVGRVIEVAPFSARVILLLDPESRASGFFQESRDVGVVEGEGSPWLRVTHIERDAVVKVGDRVLSSGLGGVYPKGIPMGRVEMVGIEKEGLELFASLRPFVNYSRLEEVLCLASSPSDS